MEEDEIGKIFGFVAVMGDISLIIGISRLPILWPLAELISSPTGSLVFNSMFTPLEQLTGVAGMAYIVGALLLLLPITILVTGEIVRRIGGDTSSPDGKHVYTNEGYTNSGEK